MRGIAAIIATAIFLLAPMTSVVPTAEAQVNNSTLTGTVCTSEGNLKGDVAAQTCDFRTLPATSIHLTRAGQLGTTVGAVDETATADADGNFAFSSLADGDYNLETSRAGFSTLTEQVHVQGATEHDILLVGTKVTGTGQVIDPNGAAVEGAYVNVCCSPEFGGTDTTTDASGSFKYTTTGGYRTFSVSAKGFEPSYLDLLADGGKVSIQLSAGPRQDATIRGHVSDQHGNAVVGVTVEVYSNGGGCCYDYACPQPAYEGDASYSPSPPCAMPVYYGGQNTTTTDATGLYSIHVYGGTSVSLYVNAKGYSSYSAYPYVEKGQTLTLDIQLMKYPDKTAHIVGRVTDAQTGQGLGFISLNIYSPEFGVSECSQEKRYPSGSGTATGSMGPTTTTVQPQYGGSTMIARPDYYGYSECAIRVDTDGAYEGMVTPGYATVNVYYDSWRSCVTTTNADHSSVTNCGPEYFAWSGSLNLSANADTVLDIALTPKPRPDATVSGYLVDAKTQKAIPGGSISFYNLDNNAGGYAQADRDGSYKVGLRSGYHQVTVSINGYFTWQGVLDVPAGESPFDVMLTRGQERYGGCYDYCIMEGGYAKDGTMTPTPASPTSPGQTPSGTATSAPGSDGADAAGASGASGGSAAVFEDLHGGLGPYDPEARAKVLQDAKADAAGKASPHLEAVALLGLLALVAAAMRRRTA